MAVTYWGAGRLATALALMWITTGAMAEQPLRIEQLQRCGDLLIGAGLAEEPIT